MPDDKIIHVSSKQSIINFIRLMRPKQWIKNAFVFAPLLFSGTLFQLNYFLLALIGFVLFSLTASSVYIINDIADIDKDRKHYKKCHRPIASGAVSVSQALVLFGVLFVFSTAVSYYLNIWFGLTLTIYFVMNLLYSFKLKHVVIVDVFCVSLSYVFRVMAGIFIINTTVSPWIIVCTLFVTLLIAIQKRRGEFASMETGSSEGRKVLSSYTKETLHEMSVTMGAASIVAYSLYTFNSLQNEAMMLTIPFVVYGLFRYQLISMKTALGESPEEILIKDKPMLIDMGIWAVLCIGIIYFL